MGGKNPITVNFVILMCEVPVKLISLVRRLSMQFCDMKCPEFQLFTLMYAVQKVMIIKPD